MNVGVTLLLRKNRRFKCMSNIISTRRITVADTVLFMGYRENEVKFGNNLVYSLTSTETVSLIVEYTKPTRLLTISTHKEKIVGEVMVTCVTRNTFAHISLVNIANGYRSKGIGTAILSEVFKELILKGCLGVTLYVEEDGERARKFYLSLGFTKSDSTKMQLRFPNRQNTDVRVR